MSNITKVEPAAVPQSESAMILSVIERASRDQTVDINKMKELMEMRNAMRAQEAEIDFDRAMASAQEDMQPIRADASNPQTRSKYASYAALDSAIRPVYTKHGFSVSFDTAEGAAENCIRIVAKVAHRGGHRERPHIDMPADGKGAKGGDVMTKTHATGSAVQYGRRYLLGMIFNLAVTKDDDGNAAGGNTISEKQAEGLRELIVEVGAAEEKVCAVYGVDTLSALPAKKYADAVHALKEWGRNRK